MSKHGAASKQIESGHTTQHNSRTVKHGVSRLLPYAPPWLMWVGVLLVGLVPYWLWGTAGGIMPMALMLAHEGAMALIWRMTRALSEVLRMLALASVGASMVFSICVNVLGPTSVLMSLWGGVGFTLCIYWSIRRMLLSATENNGTVAEGSPTGKLLTALNGAKTGKMTVDQETGQITQQLEANRGEQDVSELKSYVQAVGQLAGLRPGAGRLVPSQDDSGAATAVWLPVNQLKSIQPWVGPSAYGESIFAPIPIGKYADMQTARVYLTGDHDEGRALAQWLVMGMTGAGKSEGLLMVMADALTRCDFTLWAHDHVKGMQTLKPLIEGGGIDWLTTTLDGGKGMLGAVREVVRARARWMGVKGFKQWTSDCGLNLLCVWIEEAGDLGQLKVLLQLAREARSVGVVLIISLQRASHTTLDTDTRAQLSGNICFGVESSTDARFGLPDHLLNDVDYGPERWRNEHPGMAYLAAPGVDDDRQKVELRFFFAQAAAVTDAVKRGGVVRRPLSSEPDQITVRAAGAVYAKRMPTEAYLPDHPLFAKAMGMELNMTESDNNNEGTDVGSNHVDRAVSGSGAVGTDDNVSEDAEPIDTTVAEATLRGTVTGPPLPDRGVKIPGVVPDKKMSTEECRELVQRYLAHKMQNGDNLISVPDLENMTPPIPRKREWMRLELNRLSGEGVTDVGYTLERDPSDEPGTYRIVSPMMSHA